MNIPCHWCGNVPNCVRAGICAVSATMEQACGETDEDELARLSNAMGKLFARSIRAAFTHKADAMTCLSVIVARLVQREFSAGKRDAALALLTRQAADIMLLLDVMDPRPDAP
jgi:hypothetical protein